MRRGNLILILGDQLTSAISSLAAADRKRDSVLMVEVLEEAKYVKHHKKKIALIFSAMRHFAAALREQGWKVDYVALTALGNSGSFTGEVESAIARHAPDRFVVTEPGEWRVQATIDTWTDRFQVPVDILTDNRFLCSRADFAEWAAGRKQLRMEYFYRDTRRKTGLLMEGDKPEGGKWNFDADNRKRASSELFPQPPKRFTPDDVTKEVLELVADSFSDHFGDLEPFWFGVTAAEAEAVLAQFLKASLPSFGDYQDAMLRGERFLYHAVISPYLNIGLLDPLDVCRRVEREYRSGRASLNSAEGFIRQIIGWREYIRGIYWLKMPGYAASNYFDADRALPAFYWTGKTDLACLKAAITQTKEEAYAHHIQRLMVTGNFALLAGVNPKEVHEWYLAVYADAYEWVELPNTLGMSQFADGGLLGSKPYVASGNYINRMSDYCSGCPYDVKQKVGPRACPFNYLYWDFLVRHRDRLSGNPRMAQMYRTLDRMDDDHKSEVRRNSMEFLSQTALAGP